MRIKVFAASDRLVIHTLRGRFRTCRYMLRWCDLWIVGSSRVLYSGGRFMRKPVVVPRPAPKVYRVNRPHRTNILCVNFMRINADVLVRKVLS